ncbi:hypothetical protein SDC9_194357 [bioreactor metagenome]|uniref:Uncharacterized protein n=1 Tax=bioreactor metagenome TaxID=1076179 RepID=A0A645I8N3_9ZZZZ
MIQKDVLKDIIKGYYPEGNEDQINALLEDLTREIEVATHAKIRENVSFERIKRMTA